MRTLTYAAIGAGLVGAPGGGLSGPRPPPIALRITTSSKRRLKRA